MADQDLYDLIFKGELVKGADLATTKNNIGKLFKVSPDKVEAMFSGKALSLKKGVSLDAANNYRVAIKKAGARIDVVLQEAPKTTPARQGRAQFGSSELPSSVESKQVPVENTQSLPATGFTLAAAGEDLLRASEKSKVTPVDVDLTGLSLREVGGNLLEIDEYKKVESLQVNLDGLNIAEAGVELLRPEEKKVQPKVEMDLSDYSLAEPGARLEPPKPPAPQAPDVSNIRLADI